MEIQINNFKCHANSNYTFSSSGITLLKGQSGKGKTTILEAITWCLYGTSRKVEPNTASKRSKTNVTIKTDFAGKECVIYRQKRPNLLKFKVGALEQVDDVAQAQIYGIFGSEVTWGSSCYIKQELTNPLFRVSSQEKMSLLNKIAFADTDPTLYIKKIEESLKEQKVRFEVLNQNFQKQCEDFEAFRDSQNIKPEDGKTQEDMDEIFREKKETEDILLDQREKQRQHHHSSATLELLDKRISEIKTRLTEIENASQKQEEVDKIKRIISSLREYRSQKRDFDKVTEELGILKEKLKGYECVDIATLESLYEVQNSQNQYSLNHSKAESIGIDYTYEAIEHHKEFLRCIFKIQPALKLHRQITDLHQSIASLPPSEVDEISIKSQEEKIYELKRGSSVLKCPSCSQTLLHKGSCLVKCDDTPSTKKELDEAILVLKDMNAKYEIQSKRKTLIDQFDKLKMMFSDEIGNISDAEKVTLGEYSRRYLSPEEKKEFQNQHSLIHSIEVVEKPVTDVEEIRKGVEKTKLLESRDKLKEIYEDLEKKVLKLKEECRGQDPEDVDKLDESLQNLIYLLKSKKELSQTLEECEILKSQNLLKLNPGIDTQIAETEKKLESLRDILEKARVTNEAMRRKASLENYHNNMVLEGRKVYNLERLKFFAVEVECKVLEQTVNSINSTINTLAESIFDDPIRVELKLHKEVKSTGKNKPAVNIEIHYKGGVYDSPSEMSGGEKNRISLLLTLALNRLSGSPIIMLDEVFRSLDESTKERCLRALRSAVVGKTVICVDHDGVEGYYEHVIDIGQ